MTDTLADSRTSSRMFTEGVPLVVEDVPVAPTPSAPRCWPTRASAGTSPTACSSPATGPGEGWYDARLTAYAPAAAGPERRRRCTTRSRSSRGSRPTPSPTAASPPSGRRPTPRASPAAPSGWPCRRCPRRRSSPPSTPSSTPTATGCPPAPDQTLYIRPYQMAVEPFLGVRPAHEYLFLVIASPAGAYFPRGVQPVSVYLSEDYIRAAPGRHRRRQVRRQLRGQPAGPGAGHRGRLRPGRLARRGREALRRGDGRDEPVLRPRLRRRRRAGHPRAHRHPAARHHPRLADHRRRASSATRSPSGGSASTSGAQGVADGTVTETFACGTAAVITPVGEVKARTGDFTVGDGDARPADHAAARVPCSTSSTGGWPTPTAGCTGSPDATRTRRRVQRWRGLEATPGDLGRTVVTVGMYDGVHRGHQKLIGAAVARARAMRRPCLLLTFDPHPAEVVRPGSHPAILTSMDRKAELVADLGRRRDVRAAVHPGVHAADPGDVHPHRAGRAPARRPGRGGGELHLRAQGGRHGRHPRRQRDGGSASPSRGSPLADGQRPTTATGDHLLDLHPGLRRRRRHGLGGAGRWAGRTGSTASSSAATGGAGSMGYPTANVESPPFTAIPADGVYAGHLVTRDRAAGPAATGSRRRSRSARNPTFQGSRRTVEAYVLDFDGDLYGEHVGVEFVAAAAPDGRLPRRRRPARGHGARTSPTPGRPGELPSGGRGACRASAGNRSADRRG